MNKIEVKVIAEHGNPAAMTAFLARLTQRGANIKSMNDLEALMEKPASKKLVESMVALENHHTIRRFTPITVAVVGASRRFLAQIRTHSVGLNFVSASLQYSDYTGKAQFVVPYAVLEATAAGKRVRCRNSDGTYGRATPTAMYLRGCAEDMKDYAELAEVAGNDAAGYKAPQGLRNILIIQGNHDAWLNLIKIRGCNRNTVETQYVVLRIWEELLKTQDGPEMFKFAGPDCVFGPCKEGKMCCGKPFRSTQELVSTMSSTTLPRYIIDTKWPLLKEV